MNKFLQFLFCLFISITFINIGNITHAQQDPNTNNNSTTQQSEITNWNNNSINIIPRECITWMWKDCFSYDDIIRWEENPITQKNKNRTVTTIAQDIILAATYIVWTVLTIIIIYCGLMYIFAARWWSDPKKWKTWLINWAIWAILVRWAYAIVRLIQYIAKW